MARPYRLPMRLEDLPILGDLEPAGSQVRAGAALAVHQSTVRRSLRLVPEFTARQRDRQRWFAGVSAPTGRPSGRGLE